MPSTYVRRKETTMKINALKGCIASKGLTQSDVAKAIGVSQSTFSRKMKTGSFGLDEAQRLIKFLKIRNAADIFFGSE